MAWWCNGVPMRYRRAAENTVLSLQINMPTGMPKTHRIKSLLTPSPAITTECVMTLVSLSVRACVRARAHDQGC